jgi:hypothetical protein
LQDPGSQKSARLVGRPANSMLKSVSGLCQIEPHKYLMVFSIGDVVMVSSGTSPGRLLCLKSK